MHKRRKLNTSNSENFNETHGAVSVNEKIELLSFLPPQKDLFSAWNKNAGDQQRWATYCLSAVNEAVELMATANHLTALNLYVFFAGVRRMIAVELQHDDKYGKFRSETGYWFKTTIAHHTTRYSDQYDELLCRLPNEEVTLASTLQKNQLRLVGYGRVFDYLYKNKLWYSMKKNSVPVKSLRTALRENYRERYDPLPRKELFVTQQLHTSDGEKNINLSRVSLVETQHDHALLLASDNKEYFDIPFVKYMVIFHCSGNDVKYVFEAIEPLFQKIFKREYKDKKTLYEAIGMLAAYLANAAPLRLGSAATSDMFLKALMKHNGLPLRPYKLGLSWDLDAMTSIDFNDYAQRYEDLFNWGDIDYPSDFFESSSDIEHLNYAIPRLFIFGKSTISLLQNVNIEEVVNKVKLRIFSETNIKILLMQAEELFKQRRYDETIQICNQIINKQQNFINAFVCRACAYNGKQSYQLAINDLKKVIQLTSVSDKKVIINYLGMLFPETSTYSKVIDGFYQYILAEELKQSDKDRMLRDHEKLHTPTVKTRIDLEYELLEDYDESLFKESWSKVYENYLMACSCLMLEKYNDAITFFKTAISHNHPRRKPSMVSDAYLGIFSSSSKQDDSKSAHKYFTKSISRADKCQNHTDLIKKYHKNLEISAKILI